MSLSRISSVRIAGIAAAVPGRAKAVAEGAAHPAEEVAKVAQNSGVFTRHISADGVCSSDLCHTAGEALLTNLGWPRDSVDLLIFVSQTPDYVIPATSCMLQHRLGLSKQCASFDVNMGCSGYVYGLSIISSMMAGGGFKRALLLVGDTISKVVDPAERSVAYLFGDAGSATALEFAESAAPLVFSLGTDGSGAMAIHTKGASFRKAGGSVNTACPVSLVMDGPEVFNFTLREVGPAIQSVLTASGWSTDAVSAYFLHQANKFMVEYIVKRMRLSSSSVPLSMGRYGNTSCASIPLAIVDTYSTRQKGEACSVLCGFGVGFSWAAAAVDLSDTRVLPLLVMEG